MPWFICLSPRVRVAYAVAADNSVLTVAQFLAQSVAISTIQLNDQHIPMLNGRYKKCTTNYLARNTVRNRRDERKYLHSCPYTFCSNHIMYYYILATTNEDNPAKGLVYSNKYIR